MGHRWRGRGAVLATGIASAVLLAAAMAGGGPSRTLTVSTVDGELLATVPLAADGSLALRYRNSLYATLAEERFLVTADGELRLVGLAAEQLAVLEEYYAIDRPAWRSPDGRMAWTASPAHAPVVEALRVAATDLGQRTLLVEGAAPLRLWELVDDTSPTVVLEVTAFDD